MTHQIQHDDSWYWGQWPDKGQIILVCRADWADVWSAIYGLERCCTHGTAISRDRLWDLLGYDAVAAPASAGGRPGGEQGDLLSDQLSEGRHERLVDFSSIGLQVVHCPAPMLCHSLDDQDHVL